MSGRIGERLSVTLPRYIKHPAAGSGWVGDGKFMDAGAWHIFDSNLSHLSSESLRHWGCVFGPGNSTYVGNARDGYDDIEDKSDAFTIADPPTTTISWDQRTAVRLGPFPLIQDRPLARGGYGPRKIHVRVQTYVGALAKLYVMAALTTSPATPDQGALIVGVGSGTLSAVGQIPPGTTRVNISLECPDTVPANAVQRCRSDGARGPASIEQALGWLWVGWQRGTGAADVTSISAFETR